MLALFIVVAVFIVIRRKSPEPAKQRPTIERPSASTAPSAFHAVSIKYGLIACEAARNMAGKRFLSGAAPRIPLPDCDVLECKCRFVHHKDRRDGDDRRSPFGQGITAITGTYVQEHRDGQDRRKDDKDSPL
jgi:hypothetical protein